MSRFLFILLTVLATTGCVHTMSIESSLKQTRSTLVAANKVHARLCAPEHLANAQYNFDFAHVEFEQGNIRRSGEHLNLALTAAQRALAVATPCGTADRDQDTIPDVIDSCPDEPEDFDGDRDEDGCRDILPHEDEDDDGIKNIDDSCVDDPEDFDGHNDEDGCPETSEDTDGDGLIDAIDSCPQDPEDLDGFRDEDGCPEPDNDGDGVVDIRDTCPMIPEDLDGWSDEDGCPDPDNDSDGIPDGPDKCPNEPGDRSREGCPLNDRDNDGIADDRDRCPDLPETHNDYLDSDGCPDTPPPKVTVTDSRVEIGQPIQFKTGSAQILGASNSILNAVKQVLTDSPDMRLRIEGHTDNVGSDSTNLDLSLRRARAVRAFLIQAGVKAERLEANGFGETKPVDTNRTSAGRSRNRRVEFVILR